MTGKVYQTADEAIASLCAPQLPSRPGYYFRSAPGAEWRGITFRAYKRRLAKLVEGQAVMHRETPGLN